jgi:hypothetical protein
MQNRADIFIIYICTFFIYRQYETLAQRFFNSNLRNRFRFVPAAVIAHPVLQVLGFVSPSCPVTSPVHILHSCRGSKEEVMEIERRRERREVERKGNNEWK